ncbi:MAG: hypothetical protein JO272_08610 [Pseudonocardiales bacterium]|nr:hypothetical protein [Pseudonocardiales bacterium]
MTAAPWFTGADAQGLASYSPQAPGQPAARLGRGSAEHHDHNGGHAGVGELTTVVETEYRG